MFDQSAFTAAINAIGSPTQSGVEQDLTPLIKLIEEAPLYQKYKCPTLDGGYFSHQLRPASLAKKAWEYAQSSSPDDSFDALSSLLAAETVSIIYSTLVSGIATPRPIDLGHGWRAIPANATDPHLQHIPQSARFLIPQHYAILRYSKNILIKDEDWSRPTLPSNEALQEELLDGIRILSLAGLSGVSREAGWVEFSNDSLEGLFQFGKGVNFYQEESPYSGPPLQPDATEFSTLMMSFLHLNAKSQERLRTALDRLNKAYCRRNPGDKALDGSIALETALATADEHGEISYRIRLRASLLIGKTFEERTSIWQTVSRFYGLRSTVVHGGVKSGSNSVEITQSGIDVIARVIRKLVEVGDISDWKAVELSGSPTQAV